MFYMYIFSIEKIGSWILNVQFGYLFAVMFSFCIFFWFFFVWCSIKIYWPCEGCLLLGHNHFYFLLIFRFFFLPLHLSLSKIGRHFIISSFQVVFPFPFGRYSEYCWIRPINISLYFLLEMLNAISISKIHSIGNGMEMIHIWSMNNAHLQCSNRDFSKQFPNIDFGHM